MARGWESKSVESQVEDATRHEERRVLTAEARRLQQLRNGLELSRSRVLQELEATASPVRREALRAALVHLDGELAKLAKDAPAGVEPSP